MSKNTYKIDYEVYNVDTNETIDRKSMWVEVTDRQIRELAQVMENNGGYAPELSVFQKLYEYLFEECINDYQEYYAPDDEDFWNIYSIDLGDSLPDGLLQAAEKYVRYKEVDIVYYYENDGEGKSGYAFVQLPSAIYWTMVSAAATKPSEREDFAHLKETFPHVFDEVMLLVAKETGEDKAYFILKEFPYQVLEQACSLPDFEPDEPEPTPEPKAKTITNPSSDFELCRCRCVRAERSSQKPDEPELDFCPLPDFEPVPMPAPQESKPKPETSAELLGTACSLPDFVPYPSDGIQRHAGWTVRPEPEPEPEPCPSFDFEPETAPKDTYLPKPVKESWKKFFRLRSYNTVYSSIFAPAETRKGAHLLIQVYLHLLEETEKVKKLAVESNINARRCDYTPLSCKLRKGDAVVAMLNIYGEKLLMTQKKTMLWQGSFTKCSFDCFVPKDIDADELSCTAVLTVNGAQVGEMMFVIRIVKYPHKLHPKVFSREYRKIFISYSHLDEDRVRMIARAYAAQGVNYFFDRDNLKPGDIFPLEIEKYIDDADLFILCWSANAAKSKYVMKELEHALERAYPKVRPIEEAPLSIYPMSIEPRAEELPDNMKELYNFEII